MLVFGVIAIGTAFWFQTAPDLRFGVGWMWSAALLFLALGFWAVAQRPKLTVPLRLVMILMLAGAAKSVADKGLSYVERAGWPYRELLYAVPPMPTAETVVQKTNQGVPIKVVQNSRCFWVEPLCTPYFRADLVVIGLSGARLEFHAGH
jgi:hypothetical protein